MSFNYHLIFFNDFFKENVLSVNLFVYFDVSLFHIVNSFNIYNYIQQKFQLIKHRLETPLLMLMFLL